MDLISTLLESIFVDIFFQVPYLPPIQGAAAGSLNFTGHAEAMLVTWYRVLSIILPRKDASNGARSEMCFNLNILDTGVQIHVEKAFFFGVALICIYFSTLSSTVDS